jgi:hypothetical protein
VRLRHGDSDRDIARARLMRRPEVAVLRALAAREGWVVSNTPLPEDAAIATAIGQARRARSTISSVEPDRDIVARWAAQVDFGAGPKPFDPARRSAPHLVLRDDAVLLAVRRVRLGSDGGHLAGLSSPRLRMVRLSSRAGDHRQRQVSDHPRVCPRPAGAACLRRMC